MSSEAQPDIEYKRGRGNWQAFDLPLEWVMDAASEWRRTLGEVPHPWLCWNVHRDWCVVQQRLVRAVGWTPVVGFDPRVGPPPIIDGAIMIDFNRTFSFPTMFPHFVIEFAFLFTLRLAFWHSDLLIRIDKMKSIAHLFEGLANGEMAAVPTGGLRSLFRRQHRYWELIGCTTAAASRDQFDNGCGWWMHFYCHPNFAQRQSDERYYWDYGAGIIYWKRQCGGHVKDVPFSLVSEGHFSRTKNRKYRQVSPNDARRHLNLDLPANYDLATCAKILKLQDFL